MPFPKIIPADLQPSPLILVFHGNHLALFSRNIHEQFVKLLWVSASFSSRIKNYFLIVSVSNSVSRILLATPALISFLLLDWIGYNKQFCGDNSSGCLEYHLLLESEKAFFIFYCRFWHVLLYILCSSYSVIKGASFSNKTIFQQKYAC